ncbi:low molecular weight protein arginine phosphatase [Chryseomicrobium palamuruense]|uniref:Low molecular weight protein arginine phosphatase n=1 Tax=Chryseomicrobium palamuruense TaxID=682973 RepID=A0ABV8USL9_9BACL
MKIVFVCTGNTCRSPMAAAIWREQGIEVQSAGVHAAHGAPMSHFAQQALAEKGLPAEHSSQPVTAELLEWADVVLTMTSSHKEAILYRFPHVEDKVYTYAEYAAPDNPFEIADPFGGTLQDYQFTLYQLEELQKQMLMRLEKNSD